MTYLETASQYAEELRKAFTEELIIYEDNQDSHLDLTASGAYHEAVDICSRWLRELLLGELELHPEYSSVSCTLRLPCSNLNVSIAVTASDICRGRCVPEMLDTLIGTMDEFVFRTLKMYENPVAVLYKHMQVLAMHIHHLLALRGSDAFFLTQELLMQNGINDPICVHMMDNVFMNIGNFFEIQE